MVRWDKFQKFAGSPEALGVLSGSKPPQDILEKTYDVMKPRPKANNRNGSLAWPAYLRKLDRIDPSYRN